MPMMGDRSEETSGQAPFELDVNVPQSARVYDYWLGGKDNYPADQAMGEAIAEQLPTIRHQVRAQRAFLGRAVRYLARDAGIRQFLDIGTGIPSAGNVHDVAQEFAPDARVLYVDNDPIVLVHAQALRPSTPQGVVSFIQADLRTPKAILGAPEFRGTLDLTEPIALVLVGIMHHLRDDDDPQGILATLIEPLASGSHLVLSQSTPDFDPAAMAGLAAASEQGGIPNVPRSFADTAAFFADLEMVEPGLVPLTDWRPDPGAEPPLVTIHAYGGVARKP